METSDVGALHHLPRRPPPLPGEAVEHNPHRLPQVAHTYTHTHTHSSLLDRPTPLRLPQRGLDPDFNVNSYHLNILDWIEFNPSLRSDSNTPFHASSPPPFRHLVRLESMEEGFQARLQSVTLSESTIPVSSFIPRVLQPRQVERDRSMEPKVVEEGDTIPETMLLDTTFLSIQLSQATYDTMHIDLLAPDVALSLQGSVPTSFLDATEPSLPSPAVTSRSPSQTVISPSVAFQDSSPMVPNHTPVRPLAMCSNFRTPEQVAPEGVEQRIGKVPGYQGLAQKRRAGPNSDTENEPHGIEVSATRILKRPFKPPSMVKLPTTRKVTLKPAQPTTPTSKPRGGFTRRLGTTRRSKPFNHPAKIVDGSVTLTGSSPSPRANRRGKGSAMDLNKTLIVSLENRLRIVRNAINLDKSKNDGVVEGRVHTWRDAGREVTDMLFSLLPRPNEGCECGVKPPQWDDCGYRNDLHTHGFTPEQLQYLVNAPTDANGDILDEAGNRVFGDNDDIGPFIKQALPLGRHTSTTPPYHAERYHMPKIDHSTWDRGAMLQRLGVDPDLLGWDREAEDWMETGE